MKLLPYIAMALTFAAATSCGHGTTEHLGSINVNYLDTTTSPGQDFYTYVNKGWLEANPLTDEYARYGRFNSLSDSSEVRVRRLVEGLGATNPEPGTVAYKVWTVYSQAMDTARRNAEGATPILADLKKIEDTPDGEMGDLFMWMHKNYASPFFGAGPMEDMTNSMQYAMYLGSTHLGMGDRDYYLLDDERNTTVRNAYKTLIATQMQNAGYSEADAKRITDNVMAVETALAKDMKTREESRDIAASYNPRSIGQIKELYPAFDWDKFFVETMGIATPDSVIVDDLKAVDAASKLFAGISPRQAKDYYLWLYVNQASGKLSQDFTDANFEFSKVMSGVKEMRPLWKRALGATEGALGEAVGQLYVEEYFPQSSKEYMIGLVENLRTALGQHIDNLEWMSDSTKARAREKLAAFTVKIGYPDKWKDYTSMNIDPKLSYYENMHNVGMWHQAETYAKWGKPVDRTEWGMTPQTVNAYYNPLANEIVFPAAILQAPFFDPNATDAENYGGIGVVIGHEMTHGFDDQGRSFDGNGNMVNWWTAEDEAKFNEKTAGLAAQFDEVEILPGLHANGRFTLGENIADQGGLRVAMTAFLNSQEK
ncbi:MAG: M13 family metallopeptidase, partial [Duncaniella sp.]|nr:M13 family metallopeptidase [Duncaniella sp.]